MTTLPYGYENPTTGDLSKGTAGWMAQVNFDLARMASHSHNGIDSALLTSTSFAPLTTVAAAGSWTANAGGSGLPSSGYVQTVTAPTGVTEINNAIIKFLVNTAGVYQYEPLELFYARLTGTTFNLYCSTNTFDVLCVFK